MTFYPSILPFPFPLPFSFPSPFPFPNMSVLFHPHVQDKLAAETRYGTYPMLKRIIIHPQICLSLPPSPSPSLARARYKSIGSVSFRRLRVMMYLECYATRIRILWTPMLLVGLILHYSIKRPIALVWGVKSIECNINPNKSIRSGVF